jgi:hypothetical protein
VPGSGGRRGRRDNGLTAAQYEAAGDIDPRVGEHLLDVLAAGGIAAYLQPSTDQHPLTRSTDLPTRPTDRLYVDRDYVGTARGYIDQVTVESDPKPADTAKIQETGKPAETGKTVDTGAAVADRPMNEHDAWEEIVAGYHLTVDPDRTPWPRSEDVTRSEPHPLTQIDPDAETQIWRREPAEPSLIDALDTFGAELPPDDDDEGYTPPPAPPLPRISPQAALAVAAIAFGLLLLVWPGILPLPGQMVLLIAFGSMVGGFGVLIWRLRPDGDDDDYDDGARV